MSAPYEFVPDGPAYRIDERLVDRKDFYAVACDPARSVVVEACAGAGKTWMLVSRILRALLAGVAPGLQALPAGRRRAVGRQRSRAGLARAGGSHRQAGAARGRARPGVVGAGLQDRPHPAGAGGVPGAACPLPGSGAGRRARCTSARGFRHGPRRGGRAGLKNGPPETSNPPAVVNRGRAACHPRAFTECTTRRSLRSPFRTFPSEDGNLSLRRWHSGARHLAMQVGALRGR